MDAIFEAGFSSPSVVFGASAGRLGMTPGRFQRGGAGEHVSYTEIESDIGPVLVAATTRGLVAVRMGPADVLVDELARELPNAEFARDDELLAPFAKNILDRIAGDVAASPPPLDIAASSFQARVWSALTAIPAGTTESYAEVARAIGSPSAVRAVAGACAANPVALVIPCHRVVRTDGSLAGHRWGIGRKETLLEREATNRSAAGG